MISTLKGRVVARGENHVIVDVGGIGFRVSVPTSLLARLGPIGQEASLFTHMHVRENEISLYGCGSADELALFQLLLGVSGIGPKVALGFISLVSRQDLRDAIARGDTAALTRIPGVGRKTAERVMLDLKDKLGVGLEFVTYPALTNADVEVISALTFLGYSVSEAQAALHSLPQEDLPLEERIRLALRYFVAD